MGKGAEPAIRRGLSAITRALSYLANNFSPSAEGAKRGDASELFRKPARGFFTVCRLLVRLPLLSPPFSLSLSLSPSLSLHWLAAV